MHCKQCGTEIGAEDRFCRHCGHDQSLPATIEPPSPDIGQTLDRAKAVVSLAKDVNQLVGPEIDSASDVACPKCGASNPLGAMRCSECWSLLPKTVAPSEKVGTALDQAGAAVRIAQNVHALHQDAQGPRCPHCNLVNAPSTPKCTGCGTPLPTPAPIDQALDQAAKVVEIAADLQTLASSVQETPATVGAPSPTPSCAVCGATNPAVAVFCNRCGAPLDAITKPGAGILTAAEVITEQDAHNVARKTLKRETIVAAKKTMLPLWRVQYHEKKGLFGSRQTDATLYLNGYDGAMLSVEKKAVMFIDDASVRLDRIKTLEGDARLVRRPAGQLLNAPLAISVSKDDALHLARKVLQVDAFDAEIVLYPLWQFTIEHNRNNEQRTLLVDAIFGRDVIAVERPAQVAARHVTPSAAPSATSAPAAPARAAAPAPPPTRTAAPQLLQAPPASARDTVFIEGVGQQRSIQDAIKAASKNARILIYPGTYREALSINKPVELIGVGGQNATVIETTDGISVEASGVVLRGLTVRGSTSSRHKHNTVFLKKGQLTLEDCAILGGLNGVSTIKRGDLILRKCLIEGSQMCGVSAIEKGTTLLMEDCTVRNHAEVGINVSHKANATLRTCTVSNPGKIGCAIQSESKATLEHVTVSGCTEDGFHVNYDAVVTLKHCTASNNKRHGMLANSQKTTKAEHCEFSQNGGCGVVFSAFGALDLTGSTITHNAAAGVYLGQSSKGVVRGCTIKHNRGGAWKEEPPHDVKLARNKT